MTVELLAMAPAGEVFFARDVNGRIYRHHRFRPGAPLELSESAVERAIARYGMDRLGRSFDSYSALAAFVEERVPKYQFDTEAEMPVGSLLARRAPGILAHWIEDPARVALVPTLIARLLSDDSVRANLDTVGQLASLLERAQRQLMKNQHRRDLRLELTEASTKRSDKVKSFYDLALA